MSGSDCIVWNRMSSCYHGKEGEDKNERDLHRDGVSRQRSGAQKSGDQIQLAYRFDLLKYTLMSLSWTLHTGQTCLL